MDSLSVAMRVHTRSVTKGRRNPLHLGLPARLKAAYKGSNLTQRQIGDAAGVSFTIIHYASAGTTVPRIDTIERLAAALGVSPCWLAYGQHGARLFRQRMGPEDEMRQGVPAPPPHPLACMGLGARLQLAREMRHLTRKGLGRVAETSGTTILSLEADRTMPGADLCEQIAHALKVSPCWLAYGDGQAPGPMPDDSEESAP